MRIYFILLLLWPVSMAVAQFRAGLDYNKLLTDRAQAAEVACIAEFTKLGNRDVGPPGQTVYTEAEIKLWRNITNKEFKFTSCYYYISDFKEQPPLPGKNYLMLGYYINSNFRINRFFEPTQENIRIVEQIFRERGIEISPEVDIPPDENIQEAVDPHAARLAATSLEVLPTVNIQKEKRSIPVAWLLIGIAFLMVLALLWMKRRQSCACGDESGK
jgi:hypothetical protein